MPRCLLMLLATCLVVLSTVVAASIPTLRQRRAGQKQLTLSGDDIVALERILTDVDRVLGSVQVKLCSSSEANTAECKSAARASRPGYTPDNIAQELRTNGERKRWAPSCSVGAGMQGYSCRMDQVTENDQMADFINGPMSPGKRQAPQKSMVEDLARKRLGLKLLQRYLADKERRLNEVRKRNCRINLGGHCATETVADMVDLYHFLSSADSPGRRKRRHADKLKTNKNMAANR